MHTIDIYDTTLRDGTQGEDVQLSVHEKLEVARLLDDLGVAYIEGGWPGSNPRDAEFFERARALDLGRARLAAFGATRRADRGCGEDASIQALLAADVPVITVFGKAWRFHATDVLRITPEQNLELIRDTCAYLKARVDEVIFDAEHFFDGAADDEAYALAALRAAAEGGADVLVLCDTNGGTLPGRVAELVHRAQAGTGRRIGIHTHNDAELAVANALVAVEHGATMVQGTLNGIGERCGNANLVSIIPAIELKMGLRALPEGRLAHLTAASRRVDAIVGHVPWSRQPYVGRSAFAHKGGVHVHAVLKDAATYEHVPPESVGNARRILVSDLSGRATVALKAQQLGLDLDASDPMTRQVLERVKELENEGYAFEEAEASLELLIEELRGNRQLPFTVEEADVNAQVVDWVHGTQAEDRSSQARIRLTVAGRRQEARAEGNGPVHALGVALSDLLARTWPEAARVRLIDYRVRILDSGSGVAARVRVLVRATDGDRTWGTVGVSTNVVAASWHALVDAYEHWLMKRGEGAPAGEAAA